ncbi:hypothetical protein [uncultured Imperialibacter sp.]|uniref:hypothetical protein n=1 Tax=uncultured Imperialibacter sp. TaxID=1672639 RepID=UPI0030DB1B1A|tara:strand:+ start:100 stop:1257 length:1158 start_codon:yes stop_codon:yes gene_type:complete
MRNLAVVFFVLLFTLFTGCDQAADDHATPARDVTIVNDETSLNSRMVNHQDTVYTTPENDGGRTIRHFRLILRSTLTPPVVDENTLQASSLQNHQGGYLVSYNYQGEAYYGGVDFVDADLRVTSEILYNDADIHSLTLHDRYVYLTGAKKGEEQPAYIERVSLDGGKFSMEDNTVVGLGSYAATSAIQHQGDIFVTTGSDETNGGGVYKLDRNLTLESYTALHDARWIFGSGNELFVAQGTPGNVTVFDSKSMGTNNSFSFDGANVPEAKTTLEVDSKRIFVAAGTEGVKILDIKTGELLHTITFDEGVVTNAVSAEHGLLFISNGEDGAYVAVYEEGNNKEAPEVLGKIDLGKNQSVNHVLFRNYRLWIAAGLEGVHQVDIEIW